MIPKRRKTPALTYVSNVLAVTAFQWRPDVEFEGVTIPREDGDPLGTGCIWIDRARTLPAVIRDGDWVVFMTNDRRIILSEVAFAVLFAAIPHQM
jgi:hypothetical protein